LFVGVKKGKIWRGLTYLDGICAHDKCLGCKSRGF
jgi:hypothetical protein